MSFNTCDVNSLTYELDDAGHHWALHLTEAKPLYHFTEMARYYVVFNGKTPEIYQSWHECSKHVLRVRNAIYKKYSNYEQAIRDF
jgi:hypothetical protein